MKKKKQLSLLKLFTKRNEKYKERTDEIFKRLSSNVLPSIIKLLALDNKFIVITWDGVDILEDVIIIIADISYALGVNITNFDGTTTTITKENEMFFHRYIRVGVPIKDIENLSIDEVVSLLQRLQQEAENNIPHKEFDLNELSDEQRKIFSMVNEFSPDTEVKKH